MVDGFPDIQRLKTDVFRDRVQYVESMKMKLAEARRTGKEAVEAIEAELGDIAHADAAVVVDLFLSYRAVEAWDQMISLVDRMARPLAVTVMIREQLGLALNRAGQSEKAERTLLNLIDQRGASSETCGILGRIYKDRWLAEKAAGNQFQAAALLGKAIDTYVKGFEVDWRDAYPGVNAVTLMEHKHPIDPRQNKLLPVVTFAVEQRINRGQADYWDYATRLELAILGRDSAMSEKWLGEALAHVREAWEPKSTANNLRIVKEAWQLRGDVFPWIEIAEMALLKAAEKL
jgi:tetratricopeptide (TPR) repeat protein